MAQVLRPSVREAMSKVYVINEQVTTKKAPYLHYQMWHRKQEEYSQQLLV